MNLHKRAATLLAAAAIAIPLLTSAPVTVAQTTPKLSGAYALKIRRYCQPFFSGQAIDDPTDGDAQYTGFFFPGSIKEQIGVVTFNPTALTFSGSMIKISGAVAFQDLTALGISSTNETFTTTTQTLSGTFSTTPTTFTVNSADGTVVFQAVYGAFSGTVAHVVLFATPQTDSGGNSCVESGELQFK